MEAVESEDGRDAEWRLKGVSSPRRNHQSHRGLLIVQRNSLTARSLKRYLGRHFSQVWVASSPASAEQVLAQDTVTHLICGNDFGAGERLGRDLVQCWRDSCPDIRRAVLATASDVDSQEIAGVDGVFSKPTEPALLLDLLAIEDYAEPASDASTVGGEAEFSGQMPHILTITIEEKGPSYEKVSYQSTQC
jgi:ActR/RegA family two-component response regulator